MHEVILFLTIAQTGTLSSAARRLGLAPSTAGRQLDELEARLGAKLFERTPRGVRLTTAGHLYHDEVHDIPTLLAAAEDRIHQHLSAPAGALRVVSPGGQLWDFVTSAAIAYKREHPDIDLELVSQSVHPPPATMTELTIRASRRSPPADRICRVLGKLDMVVCAAPAWVEAFGPVATPTDLARHRCIVLGSSRSSARIQFDGPQTPSTVTVPVGFFTSNAEIALRAAIEGLGPVGLPRRACRRALDTGALVELMPGWKLRDIPVTVLWRGHRQLPLRGRIFVDRLVESLERPET